MARIDLYNGTARLVLSNGVNTGALATGAYDETGARLRDLTAPETARLAQMDAGISSLGNREGVLAALQTALADNRTFIAAAKPGTAAAQASAAYDQAVRYGRQLNALIRLALNQLDGTE